jgi:hypothetical protein
VLDHRSRDLTVEQASTLTMLARQGAMTDFG